MRKGIFVWIIILLVLFTATVQFKVSAISLKSTDENCLNKYFKEESKIKQIITNKKRVDFGLGFLIDVLNHNNRLDYYDLYLKLAKREGYVITSYADYIEKYKNTDKKVLILRHDIDEYNEAIEKMFKIEKRNHVKATYYFRWVTFDKEFIDKLNTAGFEVGLHYETLSTYCNTFNKKALGRGDIDKCREILKQEIINFKSRSGVNIKTIASHGASTNIRIKIPNNVLFEGENYSDYGIISETYDKDIINNYITEYICDYHLYQNFGFQYKANPIDAIMKGDKVIEFLSHPNHWILSSYERSSMLRKLKVL
jgi:hypothetical protein